MNNESTRSVWNIYTQHTIITYFDIKWFKHIIVCIVLSPLSAFNLLENYVEIIVAVMSAKHSTKTKTDLLNGKDLVLSIVLHDVCLLIVKDVGIIYQHIKFVPSDLLVKTDRIVRNTHCNMNINIFLIIF